jgi:hypothetical protein
MRSLTERETESLWEEARGEHPGDPMLQEIRFVRLHQAMQTQGMTIEERIRFFNRLASEASEVPQAVRKAS